MRRILVERSTEDREVAWAVTSVEYREGDTIKRAKPMRKLFSVELRDGRCWIGKGATTGRAQDHVALLRIDQRLKLGTDTPACIFMIKRIPVSIVTSRCTQLVERKDLVVAEPLMTG